MPEQILRRVGMACFVACFEDFHREAEGKTHREATKLAMFERGGAQTQASAATKAASGFRIFREGLAHEALKAISQSTNTDPAIRERARLLLQEHRSL